MYRYGKGQRINLLQEGGVLPAQAGPLGASVKPLPPQPLHSIPEGVEPASVTGYPVVLIMALDFEHESSVLVGDHGPALGLLPGKAQRLSLLKHQPGAFTQFLGHSHIFRERQRQ
jgi:hypothetical protein